MTTVDRETMAGEPLRFVRTVLGTAPRWGNAAHAASLLPLVVGVEPKIGAVCFYGAQPLGWAAIYVGTGKVLTVDTAGTRCLYDLEDELTLGPFLGWVRGDNFRHASNRGYAGDPPD